MSKVELIFSAIDQASGVIGQVTDKIDNLDQELLNEQQTFSNLTDNTNESTFSFTELKSGVDLGMQAFRIANQVLDETVGSFQRYAQQVRDLSAISGESAENTSRFIQVLDDYRISADNVTTATKALTRQGLAPNIDTLARLSDQYLAITDAQARNEFVLQNLGRAGLEWNQVLAQGGDALRAQARAVQDGLILNDKMLERAEKLRLAQDNLNDSWEAFKIQVGEIAVPVLTKALENFNNRAEKTSFVQALLLTGFDDISRIIFDFTDKTNDAADATNGLADAQNNAIPTAEELAAAQQAISDANHELLSTIGQVESAEGTYQNKMMRLTEERKKIEADRAAELAKGADANMDKLAEYDVALARNSQAVSDNQKEHDIANKKIILGLLERKLTADGILDDKELNFLLEKGKAWGVYSQTVIDEAKKAVTAANELANAVHNVPENKNINFNITQTGEIPMFGGGGGGGNRRPIFEARSAGGPILAGRAYIVGESGPETFVSSSNGTITPATPNRNIIQSGQNNFDYDRMARIMRDALLQVSR